MKVASVVHVSGRVSAFASNSKPPLRNRLVGGGGGGGGVPPTVITVENSLVLWEGSMAIAATLSAPTSPLTAAVNELCGDPGRAAAMGRAGRERAVHEFGWDTIAHRTVELYQSLLSQA